MGMLRLSELKLKDEMRKYFNLKFEELKDRVNNLQLKKKFYILTNEKDKGCMLYAKHRATFGSMLGIEAVVIPVTDVQDTKQAILEINSNRYPCMLDKPTQIINVDRTYTRYLAKGLDVDGIDMQEWIDSNMVYTPATPKGILNFLSYLNLQDFDKLKIAIVGQGKTVGKPLITLLANYYSNEVMYINKKTSYEYMMFACKNADIIVCASGVKGSIGDFHTSDTKPVLVFNVGTCIENGKLVNEYQPFKSNIQYTDTRDSVGTLTMLALFDSVISRMEV